MTINLAELRRLHAAAGSEGEEWGRKFEDMKLKGRAE